MAVWKHEATNLTAYDKNEKYRYKGSLSFSTFGSPGVTCILLIHKEDILNYNELLKHFIPILVFIFRFVEYFVLKFTKRKRLTIVLFF